MSLLWVEGFDGVNITTLKEKGWTMFSSNEGSVSTTGGRRGGGAWVAGLSAAYGSRIVKAVPGNPGTIVAGAAVSLDTFEVGTWNDFMGVIDSGGNIHLYAQYNKLTGEVRVYKHDTSSVLCTSAAGVVPFGSGYHYIELRATISDTVGAVDIHVDGVSVCSASGTDTRNGGNGDCGSVYFGLYIGYYGSIKVDDVYTCDTNGAMNYDFLGDSRVDTIIPNGAGTNTQFTPLSGSNYANVDESPHDSDTTYNSSSTLNHIDTYAMSAIDAVTGSTIRGVQVNVVAKKDDAGSRSIGVIAYTGTIGISGNNALGTAYSSFSNMFQLDPNTAAAWTEAGVNGMECGLKVTV